MIAISPLVVTLPFDPVIEKLVPVMSFAPKERAVPISASETSIPSVMTPTALTLIPSAIVISESKFSRERSWAGD